MNTHTHTQQVHLRAQEYSLQNMSKPEEFGHVQFETKLIVTLNFRTQIESTELRLKVLSKSSGASSPFHFKRKHSSSPQAHFQFSCFYPTRKQIVDVYRKTFKIEGRPVFTDTELSRLSEMSVSESFNPFGIRIVTQGSLLKDLYVLTCGECDVVRVSSEKNNNISKTAYRKEGWILKRRTGWYVWVCVL